METNATVDKEVVMLGDKAIDKDSITPSDYFEYVKNLKHKLNFDEYDIVIDTTLKMLKKATITGQTSMAKELTTQLQLALKELEAARAGFDIFVNRKDIERYIESVEAKSIKITSIADYERNIPDDVVEKIEVANKLFDELYIVFTDYTKKETKKVAKHRRDKDPVLFGAFKCTDSADHIYVEDRLFFIADWVEDDCDLTLEEICKKVKEDSNKDITYRVSIPEDEQAVRDYLDSFTKEDPEDYKIEPVSLFGKIKELLVDKITSKNNKKTEELTEEEIATGIHFNKAGRKVDARGKFVKKKK